MIKTISNILYFLFLYHAALTQSLSYKGMPAMQNFTPNDYGHIGKVWDIDSAPNGLIYMSSDNGLVEFDGEDWKIFKGSKGAIRSLLMLNDSVIYTGSDRDFGLWSRNDTMAFDYKSIYPFKEDISEVSEEFWDVYPLNEYIAFISSQNVYLFNEKQQLTKLPSPGTIESSFLVEDTLYLSIENTGLYLLDNNDFKLLYPFSKGSDIQIKGLFREDANLNVVTHSSGLFIYSDGKLKFINSDLSNWLIEAKVFCFEQTQSDHLGFGTVLKGALMTDIRGNIVHQINKQKGLLNNTILSMHLSGEGHLWLGLDFGIAALKPLSQLTYFYDYFGRFGTGYTAHLKNDTFYLGTNQGLFSTNWSALNNSNTNYNFDLFEGTEGQVWCLKEVDGQVLMGHDAGLFIKEGRQFNKISDVRGIWTILPLGDKLLLGTYNGVSIFVKKGKSWALEDKMNDIVGSCNQILVDTNSILWVNIPKFGLVKAILDDRLQPIERTIYPIEDFLGENLGITIENGTLSVLSTQARYIYDNDENKFNLLSEYNQFEKTKGQLPGKYFPLPIHNDYNFYSIYNGFAFEYEVFNEPKTSRDRQIVVRDLISFNNEGALAFSIGSKIPYSFNNITVKWIIPHLDEVKYQYRLGANEEWSAWSNINQASFLGLSEGTKTVFVRAAIKDSILDPIELSFTITPPWFKSYWAYLIYIFILIIVLYLLHLWKTRSVERQRKLMMIQEQSALERQAEKYEKEIILLEQENLQFQNEDLKQQLKNKTIELAAKAKLNDDKVRILTNLHEKLEELKRNPVKINVKWREIDKLLKDALEKQDHAFEIQIDELHQDFFHRLKDKYPILSPNDLRLCAYIKIGLNTKEMSELLNVLPSSAYISRSRLRKKLNLDVDQDLFEFLSQF